MINCVNLTQGGCGIAVQDRLRQVEMVRYGYKPYGIIFAVRISSPYKTVVPDFIDQLMNGVVVVHFI